MAHSARSHYFAGLSRSTAFLALASFFADVSTELLYPVLPVFLTETLKAGGGVVGLVDGAAQAIQNIVQGFSGWLSDRLRRRKPIALAGYAIAALAKPLIGMSSTWPGVLGARVLDRFGSGARSAPRDALIASSVSEADRGKAFGLEGFGDNLGACVGPLLAVVLLNTLHVQMRVLFYLAAIPGLISVCLIALVKERSVTVAAKSKLDVGIQRFPARYWKYLLATALFGIGNSSNAFLILQTRDVGVSLAGTILIYAAFNLVAALTSYPAGFLSDRMGRRNLLALSLGVFALTYARVRDHAPRRGNRVLFRPVRNVSGHLAISRQGPGGGLGSRVATRKRSRVVHGHHGTLRFGRQHRRRAIVGSRRPSGGVPLRRRLRGPGRHRVVRVGVRRWARTPRLRLERGGHTFRDEQMALTGC